MAAPDSRPELRDLAHEALGMAMLYATIAKQFLEVDDDRGAEYSMRKFVIYGRFASARFKELMAAGKQAQVEAHLAEIEMDAK